MTSIFEQVKAALAPRLPEVLADLLPGGRVSGREYVCASLQGGAGTSCATNLETGKGSDFADAARAAGQAGQPVGEQQAGGRQCKAVKCAHE